MKIRQNYLLIVLAVLATIVFLGVATASAADAVAFSGKVKKVLPDKNKVAIADPETKKRFTVILDDKTVFNGYESISDIKKKDQVAGKYVVTEKGLYIATEIAKK